MTATATPISTPAVGAPPSAKQQFLDAYEKEHATTLRVLRAFPADKADLQPHPKCKTARELAWIFTLERGLGAMVFQNAFAAGPSAGDTPPAPDSWDAVVAAYEKAHSEFADLVRATPDEQLNEHVKFFTGPQTLGDVTRLSFAWFLLCDEIHHRGQLSVYLRMADGKVPSIYGPSADEPWM
ncbi:MAG: DinB family protein [Gemmatimonadaceae bacterium]